MINSGGPVEASASAPEGANPERGVPIYYYLAEEITDDDNSSFSIDILGSSGELVRSYSSKENDFDRCKISNMDPAKPFELKYPPTKKGLNKWTWDGNRESIKCIENIALFAGFNGPGVTPGDYSIRVSTGAATQTVPVTLTLDPRIKASDQELELWTERLEEVANLLSEVLTSLDAARKAEAQIEALMADYPDQAELQQRGTAASELISAWDEQINQVLHQTYEDEDAWETKLAGQIRYLLDVMNKTGAPVTEGAIQRLEDLKAEWRTRKSEWQDIRGNHIEPINNWARGQEVPHVAGGVD